MVKTCWKIDIYINRQHFYGFLTPPPSPRPVTSNPESATHNTLDKHQRWYQIILNYCVHRTSKL